MEKINLYIGWFIITTQTTHVLCCGLPIIVSTISFLSGIGLMASMPKIFNGAHAIVHDYESIIIAFSTTMLVIGWALHYLSKELDCRKAGCEHEPCSPVKKRSNRILIAATILFAINITIYFALH